MSGRAKARTRTGSNHGCTLEMRIQPRTKMFREELCEMKMTEWEDFGSFPCVILLCEELMNFRENVCGLGMNF